MIRVRRSPASARAVLCCTAAFCALAVSGTAAAESAEAIQPPAEGFSGNVKRHDLPASVGEETENPNRAVLDPIERTRQFALGIDFGFCVVECDRARPSKRPTNKAGSGIKAEGGGDGSGRSVHGTDPLLMVRS